MIDKPSEHPNNTETFNFEVAMEEIKSIVASIEEGKLPLEESIKQYERAMKLIKRCQELLHSAHQKIEDITAANGINNAKDE